MAKKRVVGASRLRKKLTRLPEEINKQVRDAVAQSAFEVRDEMQRRAPVSFEGQPKDWEGKSREHLRDALEARISKNGLRAQVGLIGSRVMKVFFFARFLEFGTKKMTKRPFFLPAWNAKRDQVRARVKDATERALRAVAESRPTDV